MDWYLNLSNFKSEDWLAGQDAVARAAGASAVMVGLDSWESFILLAIRPWKACRCSTRKT